jgi:hypothetical protein
MNKLREIKFRVIGAKLKIELKSIAILLFVLVGLSGFFQEEKQKVNAQSEIKSVEDNTCLSFIQPFNLYFHYYDLHVMLYFVGHPEYEAVEAMINLQNSEKPLVRAIITRHDQTQIDYVNDQKIMEEIEKVSSNSREIHYAPIEFRRDEEKGKVHILLKFTSFKGENIVFDLYATGKPLPKHGGMTDPEGHAEESVLPVMWREKSTLASSKSKITFDKKDYKIPVKIWIPIFFKGMKGYYTEGFSIGVVTTGETILELVESPKRIEAGEKWIYERGKDKLVYEIIERNGDQVIIQKNSGVSEIINTQIVDGHLEIEDIKVISNSGRKEKFTIKFNPFLPDMTSTSDWQELVSNFDISINEDRSLVTGKIELKKKTDKIVLNLNPEQPNWAIKRSIQTTITKEEDKYHLKSTIRNAE